MIPTEYSEKVVELSDEALVNAGFLGDGAAKSVVAVLQIAKAHPKLLSSQFFPFIFRVYPTYCTLHSSELTYYMLECMSIALQDEEVASPTSPALTQLSINSDSSTVVAPALVSQFEALLACNPFPHPKPGDRFFQLPVKTAYGTWGTALNGVWHEVAPLIIKLFKERNISYSVLMSTRFLIEYEDEHKEMGPVVVWVALHPNRNTASDARDVSPDVLRILVEHGVKDAVVEWCEGVVEKLIGPPLLRVTNDTNPSYYVRRVLTAALGMPIAAKEMEADGTSQGSFSFFFHENRDKDGAPSNRVFGVSNKHVLRKLMTVDYEFKAAGAPRQYIRVCGDRRYKRFVAETRALLTKNDNGNGIYMVAKDGCGTNLTVGRYSGLEAYLCDEFGEESIELAVYNYSKTSGKFSGRGDSGSLIFTGDGRKLAVLHSGMRGLSNHVSFGTPAWWVVERLMLKYKYADFDREAF